MEIKDYDKLIEIAKTKQSDIERLKILQVYFLENVEFDYIVGISSEFCGIQASCQTTFSTQDEKEKEVLRFESLFGENFHFSEKDRKDLLNILGKTIGPTSRETKFGEQITYINSPGYNGGIYDCIKRLSTMQHGTPIYQNGLITYGICASFVPFIKDFCDRLDIKCEVAETTDGTHVFNLIQVDDQERVFDFTRMIGIRDDYKNSNNSQTINDWFNMPLEKMFKYKPTRPFNLIDENGMQKLSEPITALNYENYSEQQQQKPKSK